jgi:hypothetical protein
VHTGWRWSTRRPISTCRICGELRSAAFEDRCPRCGRWPTTAERIRPIYWLRESHPPEALARLRDTAEVVRVLLGSIPADRLRRPAPDGGWSAHQVLEHLHNAQVVFRGRIDQLKAGGDPVLVSTMVWAMEGGEVETPDLLRSYLAVREEILGILAAMPPEAWWHSGRHEEWGSVTLAEQAAYFANHEPTHLAQLADAVG